MVDYSQVTGMLYQWLLSPLMWLVIIIFISIALVGILYIRKKVKAKYTLIEVVEYGNGKVGLNKLKAGYFGKRKMFRKLWDWGETQLETTAGDRILNFSTTDYHEFDGKKAVFVKRDNINQDILVPLSKINIKGSEMLMEIAPGEYRDEAIKIIQESAKETSDSTEKVLQWVLFIGVILFALVSIIVVTQMVKTGQAEASKLIIDAGEICLKNAKEICGQIASTTPGRAP